MDVPSLVVGLSATFRGSRSQIPSDSKELPIRVGGGVLSAVTALPPALTAEGILPPGRFTCSPRALHSRFVEAFPGSHSRAAIYREWRSHRAALRSLAPVLYQWIDGSFVTDKENPSDIDVVVFMDGEAFDRLPKWKQNVVEELCNGKGSASYSHVDAQVAMSYASADIRRQLYERDRELWDRLWSSRRRGSGDVKGYLEVR
jgi:hypothetical protein